MRMAFAGLELAGGWCRFAGTLPVTMNIFDTVTFARCSRMRPRFCARFSRPSKVSTLTGLWSKVDRRDEHMASPGRDTGGVRRIDGIERPWPIKLSDGGGVTVEAALAEIAAWLDDCGVVDPEASASELLAKVSGFRSPQDMRTEKQGSDPVVLESVEWGELARLCRLRAEHTPVQYLVGEWDFHDLSLIMQPPILIPRPETEELVEKVLCWLEGDVEPKAAKYHDGLRFLDIGSGTGAIGLALLKALPEARGVAIDVDEVAVNLSLRNAERVGVLDRYNCFHARAAEFGLDLIDGGSEGSTNKYGLRSGFDFVVSNPPYIPSADMEHLMPDVVNYEARGALHGGEDGLDIVRDIILRCPCLLRSGGPRELWMEVDESHPSLLKKWLEKEEGIVAAQAGVTRFEWMRDISGLPRFVRLTFGEVWAPSKVTQLYEHLSQR
ncbi:unnamed protein product [Choristocarpus tenellus]